MNNVILARTVQLPDDDRMIETCRSNFKSFNPFQSNFSANRIPAEKQKEYNLRYLLAKVRTT